MTLPEFHLTRGLYREIHHGKRAASDLVPLVLAHLFSLCPRCSEEFEAWQQEVENGVETDYGEVIERVTCRASEQAALLDHQRRQAAAALRDLLALPPADRIRRLENGLPETYAPGLADLLIEESFARVSSAPKAALALAQLAKTVLAHCQDRSAVVVELYARATAHVANALRVAADLTGAADCFQDARFLLKVEGNSDRLVGAELDHLEASLLRARRDLPRACELLTRALAVYRLQGLPRQAARVLLTLSTIQRELGDLGRALEVAHEALELLDPEEEPRLALMARHNLAHLLQEAGSPEEAQSVVEESLPLYQRFPDAWTQLRLAWLQGNIARGLGRERDAEDAYRAVRDGFLRQGLGFDAALVSLDLALLYAEQGRARELKQLAAEMFGVFDAQDVHREAVAALMLFQEAVELEQIGSSFIVELIRYLEAARQNPELRFREPS